MSFANRSPAFERLGLGSHGSGGCVWQVDDNSKRFSVSSVFGVAPLEPPPFPQHRAFLVVGKGDSVTGPLGGVFLPGHPGSPRRLQPRVDGIP